MLLTKEVEIKLCNSIIKYYEDKGYIIPKYKDKERRLRVKRGTSILVKIEDLSEGSNILVKCDCDFCGKIYNMSYDKYVRRNHNGKTYCKDCIHKVLSGENHWNWKIDKSQEEREMGRNIPEYAEFIKKVLARDNYICQCCGKTSNTLEVHHLDGYDWCKEKRIDETNGITLCETCHGNFHSIYGKGGNTKEQFEEWIGNTLELLKCNKEIPKSRPIICLETKEVNVVDFFVEKYNLQDTHIYRCCNRKEKSLNDKHYLWYEDYQNTQEKDLEQYLEWALHNNSKKIICINTLEIFNTMTEACLKYNINSHSLLTRCCQGKANYAGKHPETGEKLKWMYYKEYLNVKNVA